MGTHFVLIVSNCFNCTCQNILYRMNFKPNQSSHSSSQHIFQNRNNASIQMARSTPPGSPQPTDGGVGSKLSRLASTKLGETNLNFNIDLVSSLILPPRTFHLHRSYSKDQSDRIRGAWRERVSPESLHPAKWLARGVEVRCRIGKLSLYNSTVSTDQATDRRLLMASRMEWN